MTINELVAEAHKTAKEKGWWNTPRTSLECMALIHSEVSEAVEDIRNGNTKADRECPPEQMVRPCSPVGCRDCYKCKPVGLPSELADIIIRVADFCGHEGIDIEAAIKAKMAYNKTRSYRHGNKAA